MTIFPYSALRFCTTLLVGVCLYSQPSLQATPTQEKPAEAAEPATHERQSESYAWLKANIRPDHPRLFFNADTLETARTKAASDEHALIETIRKKIDDRLNQPIVIKDPDILDGTQSDDHLYGTEAAEAALLYLLTAEDKYLARAKALLVVIGEYYNARNAANLNVHWYAYSRINALCAYDWIYPALDAEERVRIGAPLLQSISDMQPDGKRKRRARENLGSPTSGFYGVPALTWYAGLVFHKTGINDELAEQLLREGFENHVKVLKHREKMAGQQGGAASAVIPYAIGYYPWAEFTFFHTLQAATGYNPAAEWPYLLGFLYYIYWNWLPGNTHYGYGDAAHDTNRLPLGQMHIHLTQMLHFYGDKAEKTTPLIQWMLSRVKRETTPPWLPFTRLLLTEANLPAPDAEALPPEALPSAVFFKQMGQVLMRSGSGPDDTYAAFTADGITKQHRHYDNNNFVIFKKAMLALDSGTRPQPGQHLSHYFARTVAHNCILIRMPGETFPRYWGSVATSETPLPVPNDGGQRELLGSEIIAYSQNRDYVYIASDASDSYHKDKAQTVIRQFVFILPDVFVVFDKVASTNADYPKSWLLHTPVEPQLSADGMEFSEEFRGGRLFCRTLFPTDARLEKIGGPGKQFWSDGRNWPLPVITEADWNYRRAGNYRDESPLLGQWRVEVSPGKPALYDNFLHLIQVGDTSLNALAPSELIETGEAIGVKFDYAGKSYEVRFLRAQEQTGGSILVREGETVLIDTPFSQSVEQQHYPF